MMKTRAVDYTECHYRGTGLKEGSLFSCEKAFRSLDTICSGISSPSFECRKPAMTKTMGCSDGKKASSTLAQGTLNSGHGPACERLT